MKLPSGQRQPEKTGSQRLLQIIGMPLDESTVFILVVFVIIQSSENGKLTLTFFSRQRYENHCLWFSSSNQAGQLRTHVLILCLFSTVDALGSI